MKNGFQRCWTENVDLTRTCWSICLAFVVLSMILNTVDTLLAFITAVIGAVPSDVFYLAFWNDGAFQFLYNCFSGTMVSL